MLEPQPRKLKRVIIREEYLALTGHYVRAILLHQLEYRQKCAFDCDRYVAEEGARLGQTGEVANILPTNGWFYKKAAELAAETMLDLDETTIRRHLKFFLARGWLAERRNPKQKWDRTMQYRLNLVRLKADLEAIGYQLEGWVFDLTLNHLPSTTGNMQLRSNDLQVGSSKVQLRSGKMQEQYQNTSIEHKEQHTPNIQTAVVCASGSKFTAEQIARYVADCARRGQRIRGGLAVWLQASGKGDQAIAAFLASEQQPSAQVNESRPRHQAECPGCFGTQMEVVPRQGARRCTYAAPTIAVATDTMILRGQSAEATLELSG